MLGAQERPCIVVGIDGSPAAVDAALWAVEEAVEADIPLRLVYVVDAAPGAVDPQDQARRVATGEIALRHALTAVEATERPVKIELEMLQGRPVETLLEAARPASLLCLGARGFRHSTSGRIGSTAAALTAAARCAVAIVRAQRPQHRAERAVVIEYTDTDAGGEVMRRGLDEARRRHAPARVLTPAEVSARWDRRLAEWRHTFPDVDISAVHDPGGTLGYLSAHGDAVQLVVTARNRPDGIAALLGAPGNAALRDTDCSILVCEPHTAL
ncbi:universal stress protein [Mycobacterium sp. ITM-2016-00317]|uniref:universal stress protein n=1 Tax=Mycobacterium sp. ITM-2016-00317 TaxID=2099694 RepID=UPI000D4A0B2C|nr:universal stress protein [Mycobacterium sp. ITM-2016-00317]WNG89761.1 universal stress protein [Mycobacterium sp. ITM-2016-00317]